MIMEAIRGKLDEYHRIFKLEGTFFVLHLIWDQSRNSFSSISEIEIPKGAEFKPKKFGDFVFRLWVAIESWGWEYMAGGQSVL